MDGNAFAAIGDTLPVATNPVTMSLTRAELEADLAGYFAGSDIEVRGVLTDIAGNSRTGTASGIIFTSDQVNPTQTTTGDIVTSGGNVSQGYWNPSNETVIISTDLDNDNSLIGGSLQLQARVGLAGAYSNIGADSTIATVNTTLEKTLIADTLDAWGIDDGDILTFRAVVTDVAGNVATGSIGDNSLTIDLTAPSNFTVGNVDAAGGTVVEGYFNSSNLGASITIPIDGLDNTLIGGYVQLRSIIAADTSDFLDSVDISALNDIIFSPTRVQLEGLAFAEGDTLQFDALITDAAGNTSIGVASTEYLVIDETAPTVDPSPSVTLQGTDLSAGYWNSTSTGILFKTAIDQGDPSLIGGTFSISADLDPSANTVFERFATTRAINSLGSDTISVTIPANEVEALEGGTGFDDGLEIQFRLSIQDVAGNRSTSITIDSTLIVDQTAPVGGSFIAAGTTTDRYINDEDTLKASWTGFSDPVSDIKYYEYSLGGTAGAVDLIPWTLADTTLMDTLYAYLHEAEYFVNVRAIDSAGNVSDPLSTDGTIADLALPSTSSDILSYYYIDDWDEDYSFGGTGVDALSGPDSMTLQLVRGSDGFNWDGNAWIDQDTVLLDKLGDSNWFGKPTTRSLPANGWGFYMPTDSLDNREDYTVRLFASDSAGNWQTSADEYTFQFVINTPPEFADMDDTLDVDEDVLFNISMVATDVDLGTISGDTLYYTILIGPDSLEIDSLSGQFAWTPENADVDTHQVSVKVHDTFNESDTTSFVLLVNQVNDAPEAVTLLLPADSTQFTSADSGGVIFSWTQAFDIEGDSLSYALYFEGSGGFDTTFTAIADTSDTIYVELMDFPTVDPVEWYVRALDATEISVPSDTFHVITSPPTLAVSSQLITTQMVRYTDSDTLITLSNSGLTDLRWEELASPDWIDLAETSGRIAFTDSADLTFTIDLEGMTIGSYTDSILLGTNDPELDSVFITVHVRAYDKPRPVISFYKNPAYPGYYDMLIVDSLGMTDSLEVSFAGSDLTVSVIDTFSYLASIELESEGAKEFDILASNWVGDTSITAGINVSLARVAVPWKAQSPDKQFEVSGAANSVHSATQVVILDSALSAQADARYKILGDGMALAKPIMVSMPAEEADQAIYKQTDAGYEELPSIDQDGRIYAWSDGFGAYKLGPQNIVVPEKSVLSQNYPNPFNPTTTIEYDIGFRDGLSQQVIFEVYNIRGQVVRTLVDGRVEPGRYSVMWNALDNYGRPVSSGIYLARLMTDGGYMKTVKMLVLR
ncbi:MAG: T9SS type A sorting domain-containing protein [Candidatus Marinimicrobia bacterium]|nr:T9SS type A sorting domain-containing protein [Candidatus Neomarinimicrobiota bacterium]